MGIQKQNLKRHPCLGIHLSISLLVLVAATGYTQKLRTTHASKCLHLHPDTQSVGQS
jgi:hypothetical protein